MNITNLPPFFIDGLMALIAIMTSFFPLYSLRSLIDDVLR